MKIRDLVMIGGFGIAAATYYNNYIKTDEEKSLLPTFSGFDSSILGNIFGGVGSGEVYDTEISKTPIRNEKTIETKNNSKSLVNHKSKSHNSSNNFKLNIYKDDYKSFSHSSSKKSKKRTYHQNDDLDFTVVKDNGKIVGGFDFKQKQSLTKKSAKRLEENKNNKIIKIFRGFN